uniref:Ion transport domain-containing protein n=1 Tax=Panagrolaimus davidi TaxID=227884 RepID=A0A914P4T6_9BILA
MVDSDSDYQRIPKHLLEKRVSLFTQAIIIEDSTSIHEKLSYRQHIRQFRLRIYNFLERPRGTFSFIYHVLIFALIILVHTFSALADTPEHEEWITPATFGLEIFLAIYLTAEFCVRLWSTGADAKYNGRFGIIKYFKRPVVLIDILILFVTYLMMFTHGDKFERTTIEKIRFLQILRLLHIDRQLTTFEMIKKMISRSFEELITIYWMSALIFLVMTVSVYELENAHERALRIQQQREQHGNQSVIEPTFHNYGEAFWFSIITVLTVAILGVCMFGAASSLVGMGLSLMVENEAKMQQQTKVRNLAAKIIQTWYRFLLISDKKRFAEFATFRKFCNNLHHVEERIKQARNMAKKAAGRKRSRAVKIAQSLKRTSSFQEKHSLSYASSAAELGIAALVHNTPLINHDPHASNRLQEIIANGRKISHARKSSMAPTSAAELPPVTLRDCPDITPPNWRRASAMGLHPHRLPHQSNSVASAPIPPYLSRENSILTSDSSVNSVDFSDEEKLLDYYYDPYEGETNSQISMARKSMDTNISALDDYTISRYRHILRMLHFFMFQLTKKKFNRARKPYELIDAEKELCELEYQRMQKLKELELRVQATIGKPTHSPFSMPDGETHKLNIGDRLELCEEALKNLELKVKTLNDLGNQILESLQKPDKNKFTSLKVPSPYDPHQQQQQHHPTHLKVPREDFRRKVLFKENSIG